MWTSGYGLLILLIAGCGVLLLRSPVQATIELETGEGSVPVPGWRLRARWIFSPRCRRACWSR